MRHVTVRLTDPQFEQLVAEARAERLADQTPTTPDEIARRLVVAHLHRLEQEASR